MGHDTRFETSRVLPQAPAAKSKNPCVPFGNLGQALKARAPLKEPDQLCPTPHKLRLHAPASEERMAT